MIGIRVDANETIASGHLMRCIAIADQLKKLGQEVIFIISDSYPEKVLSEYNHKYLVLNSLWNEKKSETAVLISYLQKYDIKTLIIDSYEVDIEYLTKLHKGFKVVYIDDLAMFEYPVDILINYTRNVNKSLYANYSSKDIDFMLGAKYIPLRREFENVQVNVKSKVSDILITTGGSDNYNFTYNILRQALNNEKLKSIKFHVIIGKFFKNNNVELLYELSKKYNNLVLYRDVKNMSELMQKCDLAVSAGGTTLSELCRCGIPTICFSIADNQRDSVEAWGRDQLMFSIGDIRKDIDRSIDDIIDKLEFLEDNYHIRKKYSDSCVNVIDGNGALRIAEKVIELDKDFPIRHI